MQFAENTVFNVHGDDDAYLGFFYSNNRYFTNVYAAEPCS